MSYDIPYTNTVYSYVKVIFIVVEFADLYLGYTLHWDKTCA